LARLEILFIFDKYLINTKFENMKITLTDEQVNSLVEAEITKRVTEYSTKFNKELIKVQTQLSGALEILNSLLNNIEVEKPKKAKLTDDLYIKLWNEGKTNSQIAKDSGYNAGYISLMKKRLVEKGKIEERKK